MDIWVFGNPDLPEDALPLAILPDLRRRFPEHRFCVQDPLEEWDMPERLVIIDVVRGIDHVKTFSDVDAFEDAPRVTLHDFDLVMKLRWLKKLQKLPPTIILGVPGDYTRAAALGELTTLLRGL